jgi:hypothetical protein
MNSKPLALPTTCLTTFPTQHYVLMFRVLIFWVVYCASQINKIMSLVNQKISLEISLQDVAIFKMSQKCLYIMTLYKMP